MQEYSILFSICYIMIHIFKYSMLKSTSNIQVDIFWPILDKNVFNRGQSN